MTIDPSVLAQAPTGSLWNILFLGIAGLALAAAMLVSITRSTNKE